MKKVRYTRAYVREVGNTDGLLSGVIGSTAAVDRYGESIDQESWDLKHFKKNPVILWAHNLTLAEDRPPIGRAVKVKVQDGNLVFDIQFDMADPFAADIFRKYKEKFLNAFSVGFIPHKIQRSDDGDQPPILMDNELLELSAVPVPANPEALQALRARSFKTKTWDKLMKEVDDEEGDEDEETPEEEDKETPETPETPEGEDTPTEDKLEEAAEKAVRKMLPELTKSIADVVIEAVKPKEDKGGSGSEPKKTPQGGASPKTLAVMREATKLLQGALAEANASRK